MTMQNQTAVTDWMAWEGGVDLVAVTGENATTPNVIVHVARMVHTPVGSAPAGLILYQPDASAPPQIAGFVCADERIGAYFGPHIFAGTPFEGAPVLTAQIEILEDGPHAIQARVEVAGFVFQTHLTDLSARELIHRAPGALPFYQQGVEAAATTATLRVNGEDVAIVLPAQGISGGPAAVSSPCGLYAR